MLRNHVNIIWAHLEIIINRQGRESTGKPLAPSLNTIHKLLYPYTTDPTITFDLFAPALHVAAKSNMASPELVGHVVDFMAEKYNWPLVDELDEQGNTALHVAAQADRHDVIGQLSPLNLTVLNKDGDNPLHVAAKHGHWTTLEVGKPKMRL